MPIFFDQSVVFGIGRRFAVWRAVRLVVPVKRGVELLQGAVVDLSRRPAKRPGPDADQVCEVDPAAFVLLRVDRFFLPALPASGSMPM